MCFVGRVVIFNMRFYISGAFYAGVGTDRGEFVPDASLFFDICGSGFNGIPMIFSWQSYAALIVYLFLPIFILPKLKLDLLEFKYLP